MTKKWMTKKYLELFLRHGEHFLMTLNPHAFVPHFSVIAFNGFAHIRFAFLKN